MVENANGKALCPHNRITVNFTHSAVGDSNIRYLELQGFCPDCRRKLVFQGKNLADGVDPERVTVHDKACFGTIRLPWVIDGETFDGKKVAWTPRDQWPLPGGTLNPTSAVKEKRNEQ